MDAGGLFSDTPMPDVSMAQEVEEAVTKPPGMFSFRMFHM